MEIKVYLSELRLWNFRKYFSGETIDYAKPALCIPFNSGVNVLIGENDSGKTTIIDAMRFLLKTHSKEWLGIQEEDFAKDSDENKSTEIRIEGIFRGFTDKEASHFLEWISFDVKKDAAKDYVLSVRLTASKRENKIIAEIRAGADPEGKRLDGEAKEFLRIAYLKPLRDAENELTYGKKSRLAQILASHKVFQKEGEQAHPLEDIVLRANEQIKTYFKDTTDRSEIKIVSRMKKQLCE